MRFMTVSCCSACIYGRAMELALDKNCLLCCLLGGLCQCCNRGELREKYAIMGGSLKDCLMSFCVPCDIYRVVREVQIRQSKIIGCLGNVSEDVSGNESLVR